MPNNVENIPVAVMLLGGFGLQLSNGSFIRWKSNKSATLMASLLIDRGREVSRKRLEHALWPNADRPAGPTSLKVAVHTLRKILDTQLGADREFLRVEYGERGYRMHVGEGVSIDIHEFERLCREASDAAWRGNRLGALDSYRQAISFYRGDFLPGRSETWAREQREWLRSKALQALDALLQQACDDDDAANVGYYGRRMLDIDRTDERAFRAMMLIHARRREVDQVKYWYDLCLRRLAELDTVPAEATRQLVSRALNNNRCDSTAADSGQRRAS